jgi:glycosyltransferase involved in cell wall biosynthesis
LQKGIVGNMKIAQIAPLFESVPPKFYGGTERVVSALTEELVRSGHDVTLFASGDSMTSARLVPVCPKSLRLDSQCIDRLAHHIVMLDQVFKEKDQFDILHFHVDYIHFPLCRSYRVAHVTTLHGRLDIPDLQPLYRQYSDIPVVSISNSQRGPLGFANWKGTVYHGLSQHLYTYHGKPGTYLAFLGRISPEKGLDQAIEIARRVGMKLKIAAKVDKADQEYFDIVIKPLLSQSHVEFIGEIGYEEKSEFLGNAAALLFPIQWPEPFGLVMIEAMACGTPVVAYNRGSVAEVVDHGITGFIVHDIAGAVDALGTLSEIRRDMCRQVFEKRFSARRMARDYVAVYENVISAVEQPLTFAKKLGKDRDFTLNDLPDGVSVG